MDTCRFILIFIYISTALGLVIAGSSVDNKVMYWIGIGMSCIALLFFIIIWFIGCLERRNNDVIMV